MATFNIRTRVVQTQTYSFTNKEGQVISGDKITAIGSTPIDENGRKGLPVEVYNAPYGFAKQLSVVPGDYSLSLEVINNGGKISQKISKAELIVNIPKN